MDGFDSNDLSVMVDKVKSGTTGGLGKIQMDGFDPNNIPSDITNSIDSGLIEGQKEQPPILKQIVAVPTPTNDTTPSYTFSSNKEGQITYWGSCLGSAASASAGNNVITFNTLSEGTYSNCSIRVTDSDGNSDILNVNSFTVDITNPVIAEVTAVKNNGNDPTPDFTFSSTEEGTVAYGGSCSSDNTSASSGNNVVTLNTLSDATYSNCTVTITDLAGNTGDTITLTSFTVDTTSPTISSTSPTDGANTVVSSISATFSEVMDHSSINTSSFTLKDESNNSVSGTVTSSYSGSETTTALFFPSSTYDIRQRFKPGLPL